MRRFASVILFLSCTLLLVACGGSDSEGGGAAVTLYSPETPDMTREIAEAFEEETVRFL